jgi:hypothetical protein
MEFIGVEDSPIYVKNNDVNVFDPSTGDMRSDDAGGIAHRFIGDEGFQVGGVPETGLNLPKLAFGCYLQTIPSTHPPKGAAHEHGRA